MTAGGRCLWFTLRPPRGNSPSELILLPPNLVLGLHGTGGAQLGSAMDKAEQYDTGQES